MISIENWKKAEKERELIQCQLVQSARLTTIGTLTSGVAHEINNPLQVILSNCYAVEDSVSNRNEVSENLEVMKDAIARIKVCGKAPGILTGDEALAKHYVAQGCLFVAVGADQNVLRDSATALAQRFKS